VSLHPASVSSPTPTSAAASSGNRENAPLSIKGISRLQGIDFGDM
jgi:hypothetical protein